LATNQASAALPLPVVRRVVSMENHPGMTPFDFEFYVFMVSLLAGLMGALLGVGGGILIVPVLTLLLKVDLRYAVGASIVSVIATSCGAAAGYVRDRLTNLRVAMFLELATVSGALTGAFLSGVMPVRWLQALFASVLAYSALAMSLRYVRSGAQPVPADGLADTLRLHGSYREANGEVVDYQVTGTKTGLGLMYVAGVVSGMLGIGSGAMKVPAMDLAMRLPLKVSSATSNFMIGVTASASAGVYFARGDIDPFIAGPVCLGVTLGALVGSRYLPKISAPWLRAMFVVLLLWLSIGMAMEALT
jgi:uncharacterized membrane protein YfcA